MSEVENRFVKLGYWINWSQGPIMGKTITTDARTGNIVIAILTVLVTIAVSQFWKFITFLWHQTRARQSTNLPSDGLFWQQQALLRTLPNPIAMVIDMFKLWRVWKGKSKNPLFRCMIPGIFAMLFGVAAIIGGIFSSLVVSTSSLEILVNSPLCSQFNLSRFIESNGLANSIYVTRTTPLEAYTRQCYQDATSLPTLCQNTYINPTIAFKPVPTNCPWRNNSFCFSPAIAMDSGLLDVNSNFGLNLGPRDRVKFRRKTTCSVLPTEEHIFIEDGLDYVKTSYRPIFPGEQVIVVRYGDNVPSPYPSDTFVTSKLLSDLSASYYFGVTLGFAHIKETPTLQFIPLPGMNRTDADVAINVIVFASTKYSTPIDDPLFAAHKVMPRSWDNFTVYGHDHPVGLLGCAIQYQFCFVQPDNSDFCTPLDGIPYELSANNLQGATSLQVAVLQYIRKFLILNDITSGPSEKFMLAKFPLSIGPGLPKDQWITEAKGWEAYAYGGFQIMLADGIIGMKVRDPDADFYTDAPSTPEERQLCQSLKMRKSGDFANINVFGLAFIITFTVTITLFNMTVLKFLIFLSRFRHTLSPGIDRWIQDGIFQLQRRGFEAHGEGEWVDLTLEIPSTKDKELLAVLPTSSAKNSSTTGLSASNNSSSPRMSQVLSDGPSPTVVGNVSRQSSSSARSQSSQSSSSSIQVDSMFQARPTTQSQPPAQSQATVQSQPVAHNHPATLHQSEIQFHPAAQPQAELLPFPTTHSRLSSSLQQATTASSGSNSAQTISTQPMASPQVQHTSS